MAAINTPPTSETSRTQHMKACIFALEPSVEGLFNAALKAGWDQEPVLVAIINIAANSAEKIKSSPRVMHS